MTEGVLGHRFWERWNKLEGKSLVARFAQADMLIEVCGPPTDGKANDGSYRLLAEIAEQVGRDQRTLSNWRVTAYRVTDVSRDTCIRLGVSWKTLQMVACSEKWKRALPRLIAAAEKGKPWTVTETTKQLGYSTESRDKLGDRPSDREVIARVAREDPAAIAEAARDLSVARVIERDNKARSALAQASMEMVREADEAQRGRIPDLMEMSDYLRGKSKLTDARYALTQSLDYLRKVNLDEDERDAILDKVERVRVVLDWVVSYVNSGDQSFEKELEALLKGGE